MSFLSASTAIRSQIVNKVSRSCVAITTVTHTAVSGPNQLLTVVSDETSFLSALRSGLYNVFTWFSVDGPQVKANGDPRTLYFALLGYKLGGPFDSPAQQWASRQAPCKPVSPSPGG